MYLDRLINQGNGPMLEEWLQFTDARQRMIGEDIANISTPNYTQKDLSLVNFQSMLADKAKEQEDKPLGTVSFKDVSFEIDHPHRGILFHDGSNRSVDQLMSDEAKNALMHTLAVELLRQQYGQLDMALKERVS